MATLSRHHDRFDRQASHPPRAHRSTPTFNHIASAKPWWRIAELAQCGCIAGHPCISAAPYFPGQLNAIAINLTAPLRQRQLCGNSVPDPDLEPNVTTPTTFFPSAPPLTQESSAETIARLTPQDSLFDRSIAERRRQRRGGTAPRPLSASSSFPRKPLGKPRPITPLQRTPAPQIPRQKVTPLRRPVAVSSNDTQRPARTRRRTPLHPLMYGVRLVIVGIGLSAIAGTLLSVVSPSAEDPSTTASVRTPVTAEVEALPVSFQRTQSIANLSSQMQELAARYPDFLVGVSLVDVDTGAFVDLNGNQVLAAASTIKLPILVAFFQAVDRGEVRLDEMLTLKAEQVAEGSGTMQFDAPGTQYSALEVITQMIVISDNTATNIILDRLGGQSVLNAQFQSWGMAHTVLNEPLPDLQGMNTVSPDDLTHLLASIDRGELVSLRSRDRLLDILEATQNDSLLPQALGDGATIAHKTGNIKHSLGDSGLIDLPNGKRYVLSVIVKRPAEDDRAAEIVRQVAQLAQDYFSGAGNVITPAGNPDLPETQQARRSLDRPAQ
ncbi:MAG: serine hydrolase [Coleofasciculaceae cyanobacterium RL_1_1]|nr:serine hydrolase [Coleofasciculaceae cyanobacterium RL_1_1]